MGAGSMGIKALYQLLQENRRKVPKMFATLQLVERCERKDCLYDI